MLPFIISEDELTQSCVLETVEKRKLFFSLSEKKYSINIVLTFNILVLHNINNQSYLVCA